MIHGGIKPPFRCLALLVSNLHSFTLAVNLLRSSGRPHPHSLAILTDRGVMTERRTGLDYKALRAIPCLTSAAFVKLLRNLPTDYMCTTSFAYEAEPPRLPSYRFRGTNSSSFAFVSLLIQSCQLVHVQQPRYRPVWNALLYALKTQCVDLYLVVRAGSAPARSDVLETVETGCGMVEAITSGQGGEATM